MNILMLTIPLALLLSTGFVGAFVWATLNGQWDDLDLAPRKAILEDKDEQDMEKEEHHESNK